MPTTTTAELVTPERVLYSGEGEFVVLRSEGGEIMFLPDHAPFIAAVDVTVMRINRGEEEPEFRAAVHGGFVHVARNRVVVLAAVAEPADELDVERARRALDAAEVEISGGEADEGPGGGETVEQSPVMRALLYPDDPAVALRRAQVRLEAAGEAERPHG